MLVNTSSFSESYASELELTTGEVIVVKGCHLILIVGALVGNTLVIIGSTKYHAIDIDRVSLILIGRGYVN